MVIKTETCVYTDYKIYPGRGSKFAAKDGKTFLFINHKAKCMFHQRIKPVKLTWTQTWRRMHKKGQDAQITRRRNRKTQKFQKAIVGMSVEDIRKKKAQRPALRDQAKKDAAALKTERKVKAGTKAPTKATTQQKAQQQKATKQAAQAPKGKKAGGGGGGRR